MVKTYIRGDTEKDGLVLTWQDSEDGHRTYEHIEFADYFYLLLEDFFLIKDELKKRWGKYLKATVQVTARDEFDNKNEFAKVLLSDNNKKYLIKMWLEEEKGFKTYEMDLNTTKRYLIDTHKTHQLNLLHSRYLFYDIETDDRKNFAYDEFNKIIPENTILSIAAIDQDGKRFFFINEDSENPQCEKDLLIKIRDLSMKYSIISGWHSSGFDDVYLVGRASKHGMEDFVEKLNCIDYLLSYKKYKIEESLDSYSLDNVAKLELGEQKIDIKKGGGRLYKLYLTDKKKLEEYNMQDVDLLYNLNKKLRFMELHLMTAHKGHCNVQLTNYNIGSNDYFILMKAKNRGLIAPSNPSKSEKLRRKAVGGISGGYTRGKPGFYNKVATEDFSSLYPSLEITYNISPEKYVKNVTIESQKSYLEKKDIGIDCFPDITALKKHCTEHNLIYTPSDLTYVAQQGRSIYHPYRLYKADNIGLLPSVMIELIEDRVAVKKSMKGMVKDSDEYVRAYTEQLALKYMLNSNYGLNALPAYRFYRWDVADSITTSGRVNTKKIRAFATLHNFFVVYSDTDSIGISPMSDDCVSFEEFDRMLAEYVDEMLKDVNNKIYTRTDKHGTHNHRLILELEKVYTPLLYKKKKRYAGLIIDGKGNSYVDVTGLRSSKMNARAAILQDEFIEDVVRGRFNSEIWKKKMDDLYERCFNGQMEAEDLMISMKFTQRAVEMSRPRAHTLLAERMIERGLDVAVGDKIQYIVKEAKPKQYAVTKEEFEKDKKYPADYYWDIFTKPIISLMGIIEDINVFDIVKVPNLIKAQTKLVKLKEAGDDEKIIKLITRIDKMKKKLLDNEIDDEEIEDFIFEENR